MNPKTKPDLLEVIRLVEAGYIDVDYFGRWQRFKEHLPAEDKARWQNLLSRVHKTPNGTVELDPTLSNEEKVWAKGIIKRAERLNLC